MQVNFLLSNSGRLCFFIHFLKCVSERNKRREGEGRGGESERRRGRGEGEGKKSGISWVLIIKGRIIQ